MASLTTRSSRMRVPRTRLRIRTHLRAAVLAASALLLASCGGEETVTTQRAVKRYGIPDDLPPVEISDTDIGEITSLPVAPTAPTPGTPPAAPPTSATPAPRAAGGYEAVEVKDGGTIRGTVKLDKAVNLWTTAVQKDVSACGHSELPTQRIVCDPLSLGLANSVVYLADITKGRAWEGAMAVDEDERTAVQDQHGCKYVPHVQVVRVNTQLVVKNSDPAEHNIHGYLNSALNTAFNFGSPSNSVMDEAGDAFLERAGKYILKCDIHPWMNAYIHVVEHPYHVVTGEDGSFVLENVPPGEYTLVCWHEGMEETPRVKDGAISGYTYGEDVVKTQKITVTPNGEVRADFVLEAPSR